MDVSVEIDSNSGFCGGVIRAVTTAEKSLSESGKTLYSIGAIVHNEAELQRLADKGLRVVSIGQMEEIGKGSDVLVRAHGEPPSTYRKAKELGLNIIDCTCPVVLKLQESIREAYAKVSAQNGQIIIFGKIGHAEVLGLLGQVDGQAIVVESVQMLHEALAAGRINLDGPTEIFSQTTKSPEEFAEVCAIVEQAMASHLDITSHQNIASRPGIASPLKNGLLTVHNTICGQVANRHRKMVEFASGHDTIIFVAGSDSSNGKVLFNLCKSLNDRTYHISSEVDLLPEWFHEKDSVGVCGATSTPKWLLESVAEKILSL